MIKGSKEDALKVKETLAGAQTVYSFDNILPCPTALRNASSPNRNEQSIAYNKSKYGAKDWYDWCNANWGTKWDASDAIIITDQEIDGEHHLTYQFQTAWAPPFPVHDKLAEMFPNINIFTNYDESGCDFSGWRCYQIGELIREREYDVAYYSVRTFMEPDTGVWEYLE